MLFAHLKRILKMDRLRLRGLSGASDEFTWLPRSKSTTPRQADSAGTITGARLRRKPPINIQPGR